MAGANDVFVSLQSRGVLALPADVRQRHRLNEPGAQVKLVERPDGVIELHPHAPVPADQRWFWSRRWQAMEREAEDDIAAGRVERFDSIDGLIADLDGDD